MPTERIPTALPLHDRDFGGEAEPPYVILHGMLGSSRNWQTVGRDLASVRRTFALDLRNHGLSPHAAEMTYAAMTADVLAWMEGRGLGAVDLVGHSMGGKVAMLLACRHPEKVRRLVVVDIAPKPYAWPAHRIEYAAMKGLDLATLTSRAEAEARLEKAIPAWPMRKFLVSSLERTPAGWSWQFNLPVLASALPELEGNPLAAGDRFDGPVLFVVGGKSDYVQPGDSETIRAHFPSARIETLAGSGHNPHIDAREAFVAALGAA
jgi:esterase